MADKQSIDLVTGDMSATGGSPEPAHEPSPAMPVAAPATPPQRPLAAPWEAELAGALKRLAAVQPTPTVRAPEPSLAGQTEPTDAIVRLTPATAATLQVASPPPADEAKVDRAVSERAPTLAALVTQAPPVIPLADNDPALTEPPETPTQIATAPPVAVVDPPRTVAPPPIAEQVSLIAPAAAAPGQSAHSTEVPAPRSEPRVVRPAPMPAPALPAAADNAPTFTMPAPEPILPRVPPAPSVPKRTSARPWLALAKTTLRYAAFAFLFWALAVLVAVLAFRVVDPPGSMLMAMQRLGGTTIDRQWVPLDRISPQLVRAVVVSEDGRFCQHNGIDLREIEAAIERARDGVPRGASTISMQVAKNMFLWPAKSYVRKALELPITLAIEALWSKRRILEVYLNIAEWGPGVFGAEAAARHHFRKPAARLVEREAALLAVSLPNPLERSAARPGPGTSRLASLIQARMRSAEGLACLSAGL